MIKPTGVTPEISTALAELRRYAILVALLRDPLFWFLASTQAAWVFVTLTCSILRGM